MPRKFVAVEFRSAIVAVVLVLASVVPLQVRAQAVSLDPAKMPRIGHRRSAICFVQHRNGGGDRREFLEAVP